MTNPLRELETLGQSIWLDDIDRGHLRSGLFERLINEDGLRGATGNPTILNTRLIMALPTMSRCGNSSRRASLRRPFTRRWP